MNAEEDLLPTHAMALEAATTLLMEPARVRSADRFVSALP